MQFKSFVKMGTALTGILLVIVALMSISVFLLQPTNTIIFTNLILIVLALLQILTITVLIHIFEKQRGGKR